MEKKEDVARNVAESFCTGISINITLIVGLAGAGIDNSIIFLSGVATAFALAASSFIKGLLAKNVYFLAFLGTFFGGFTPALTFAFIPTPRIALLISSLFALFLVFVISSSAVEKKTYKDGFKAVILLAMQIAIVYYLLKFFSLL